MSANMTPASNGQIVLKYNIRNYESRKLLSSHLKKVILRAYKFLYFGCPTLGGELIYLNEAVGLLSKESDGTLLVRQEEIQASIYKFFILMEQVRLYADSSDKIRSLHTERKLRKALRKFISKMNSQTNIKLRMTEMGVLHSIECSDDVYEFSINLRLISASFQNLLQGQSASKKSTPEAPNEDQVRLALLNKLSPALVTAYEETRNLLSEARSVAKTPDDEYFIEEVSKDYYFHIFENLQKVAHEKADFVQKEAVVVESLKQFNIIQLGLHKIIEDSIAISMNAMKSQTDFLRSKVVGSRGLSLTPNELELEVDASVEQSQKLREELYKKHVAPRIEQNRLEYETQIAKMQEEHKAQIADMQGQYESEKKYLVLTNWEYKDKITKLEAELAAKNTSPANSPSSQSKERKKEAGPAATIDVAPKIVPTNVERRIQVAPITADRIQVPSAITADRIYRL